MYKYNDIIWRCIVWGASHPVTTAVFVLELLLLIYVLRRRKENKRLKKMMEAEKNYRRFVSLDAHLTNPLWLERQEDRAPKTYPFEIKWNSKNDDYNGSGLKLEFDVSFKSTEKKYLLDTDNEITIGRSSRCSVIIEDPAVADMHCRIVKDGDRPLLKKLDKQHVTVIERGKSYMKLEDKGVVIKDGDRIVLGRSNMTVRYVYFGEE